MPTTKANLLRDAESLDNDQWDARLAEVEESTAVKRDAKKDGKDDGKDSGKDDREQAIFQREEVASAQGGSGSGLAPASRQTLGERRSVVGGLLTPPKAKK